MLKKQLIELLKDLPDDGILLIETNGPDGGAVDFMLIPITVDCDDPTIMGYVFTEVEDTETDFEVRDEIE